MKKNIPILVITLLVVILIITSFTVFASNHKQNVTIEEKVSDEIKYLNNYIISLLGHFNGLTVGDTIFQTSEPKTQLGKQEANPQNETEQKKSSANEDEGDTNQEKTNIAKNGIFANKGNFNPNWEIIELRIEQLYQTWNTISIDLHGLNISGNDILSFGDGLNAVTQSIKKKDKAKAMEELTKIHQFLPKYQESYLKNDEKTEILNIEVQVVNSYVMVTTDKWGQAEEILTRVEQRFANILNTVSIEGEKELNQTTLSQCYILVNEMRNAIHLKDKDIFYIQYHNFITKMGVII